MPSESIRVTRSVTLPVSEVEFRTSRSSGPGGQHAQKSETRVEAIFDVETSSALSDAQKSQLRNKELALERLVEHLRAALYVARPRKPTKPGKAAVERRLENKKRRSQTKRLRQPPR